MSRWHKSTCAEPYVHTRNSIPSCSTCGETAVWNPVPGKASGIPPLPKPPEDGQFQLRWPASVSYAESDEEKLDLTGSAPALDAGETPKTQARKAAPALDSNPEEAGIPISSHPPEPAAASTSRCQPSLIVYTPLSKNRVMEIRLLRLFQGSLDDPIHGELVISPLQDKIAFTALSYTWASEDGDSSRNCVIFLGRHWDFFPVTENCASALRQMRLQDRDVMVWVDAICIDQGNHVERNHQVGLMTEMYSSAQRVFVYLGDGRPEIASILAKLRWPKERASITLPAARRFFGLPYFSRIWVVQEVANAKSITVRYGSKSADWADLLLVPAFTSHLPGWVRAEYHKSKPSSKELAQLLLDTASSHASDPRDSVFALFGLASDCGSQGLVADYTLTLPEVYIGAAAFAILNLGDKRVLRYAAGYNADGIPTWVPAWGNIRKSTANESNRIASQAKDLFPQTFNRLHPENCRCETWGNVTISRNAGTLKILGTEILHLCDFNLYWIHWRDVQTIRPLGPPLDLDYNMAVTVNETNPRPTGRLVLLHGSNAIFHVERAEPQSERARVIGCCEIFIWRNQLGVLPRSSGRISTGHGYTAGATEVLRSVPGRLTSSNMLKQMLEAEQEIRKYVKEYRPSLSIPQTHSVTPSYAEMLNDIYTMASRSNEDVADDLKYLGDLPIPARLHVEPAINPHLQAHLHFWETSQFWDLFRELQSQSLPGGKPLNEQGTQQHSQQHNDVDIYHMTVIWDHWLAKTFAMLDERKTMATLPLNGYYLYGLRKWARDAKYLERFLAIRLVYAHDTGALDLQIGRQMFSILAFGDQRSCLPEIRELWPDFEPWPGMSGTTPSAVEIPEMFEVFKMCIRTALEEAHMTSAKAGLLDVKTMRLVVDLEYAREEEERERHKKAYLREMDTLKALFSMCSFLRALVPQEREWKEMELF